MFRFYLSFIFFVGLSAYSQKIEIDSSDYNVQCYHPEKGYLEAFGNLKGVIPHGQWVLFDEKGRLYAKGLYKKGKRNGEWTFYDLDGNIMERGMYKKGMKQGKWLVYEDKFVIFEDGLVIDQNVFK
ncbi:MAG: hypothetical protein KDC84_01645 [Crocinitomicaceae bacterium]|nr:hypothetical protein [Crocinitomicaceae bacterium]